jgi:hypothetical protein
MAKMTLGEATHLLNVWCQGQRPRGPGVDQRERVALETFMDDGDCAAGRERLLELVMPQLAEVPVAPKPNATNKN